MNGPTLRRWLSAFGRFWWEFLVGDTPEITLGVLVVIGVTLLLRHQGVAAVVVLPFLVAVLLAASARRGRRRTD